jgi:hypothetical protein
MLLRHILLRLPGEQALKLSTLKIWVDWFSAMKKFLYAAFGKATCSACIALLAARDG